MNPIVQNRKKNMKKFLTDDMKVTLTKTSFGKIEDRGLVFHNINFRWANGFCKQNIHKQDLSHTIVERRNAGKSL